MAIRLMTGVDQGTSHHPDVREKLQVHHEEPLKFVSRMFQLILGTLLLFLIIVSKHLLAYIAVLSQRWG
jgi:hypothetical protein